MQCGTDAASDAYSWQNNGARREGSNDANEGTGFRTRENAALSALRSQQDDRQRSLPQLPREAAGKYAHRAGADPIERCVDRFARRTRRCPLLRRAFSIGAELRRRTPAVAGNAGILPAVNQAVGERSGRDARASSSSNSNRLFRDIRQLVDMRFAGFGDDLLGLLARLRRTRPRCRQRGALHPR